MRAVILLRAVVSVLVGPLAGQLRQCKAIVGVSGTIVYSNPFYTVCTQVGGQAAAGGAGAAGRQPGWAH